jgi:hypothetical protein
VSVHVPLPDYEAKLEYKIVENVAKFKYLATAGTNENE